MSRNNHSNNLIKWLVIIGDFVLLNVVLYVFSQFHPRMIEWDWERLRVFFLISNFALLISEWNRHTIIHRRLVSASDVLKHVFLLVIVQTLVAYILLRGFDIKSRVGGLLMIQGTVLLVVIILARFVERSVVKWYRHSGGNTRIITLVGDDPELETVKQKLMKNPTFGFKIKAEYKDVSDFIRKIDNEKDLDLGDELYLCVSRREPTAIRKISALCDQRVVSFFYVPMSVESIGINLKREMLDDIEIFTTHENPLQNPTNRVIKRLFDILLSLFFLIPTVCMLPIIYIIVRIQSPGPLFFRQLRTGLDGKDFTMYKFRSMHVNDGSDKIQATKNDIRKFPFGTFIRKMSIDELPQFWNVLKGDMSIIGPRPHMLAHTEMYSQLIDKYMVRHFVKPGITGWAQVTGFRGETKELWQMEERVKRDIWYMENWSIWLDIRILWLTVKSVIAHHENAY